MNLDELGRSPGPAFRTSTGLLRLPVRDRHLGRHRPGEAVRDEGQPAVERVMQLFAAAARTTRYRS